MKKIVMSFVVAAFVTAGCGAQALRPQEERTAEQAQVSLTATMQAAVGSTELVQHSPRWVQVDGLGATNPARL